ncbi:MAG: sulfatase [Longimicrobiales bacterium]|nr:sulfatase [Longimicrobiales bacterium]
MTKRKKTARRATPPPASPRLPGMPAGRLLLTALGFALWTGLAEQVPIAVARFGGVFVRVSPDLIWMAPVADAMFFGLVALVLLALRLVWSGAASRPVALGTFAGSSTLALGLLLERLYPAAVLLLAIGVGAQVARKARAKPRRPGLLPSATAAAALLILALTALGKFSVHFERQRIMATLPEAPPEAPNVLLLILDTVRGASLDFLAGSGPASLWGPVRAPTLDSLVLSSVVFEEAIAPSSWTTPSHASMFTGQWPTRLSANWGRPLDAEFPTVANVMAGHGYLTVGVVGNLLYASRETGLSRGFLYYEDYSVSLGQTLLSCAMGRRLLGNSGLRRLVGYEELPNRFTAAEVTDEFLDWQTHHGDRPFFGFVNYFDAHEPYFPPDSVRLQLPPGTRWNDFSYYTGLLTGVHARRNDKWEMTQTEAWVHANAYHAAILRADLEVGRLLMELGRRGVLENTVLIIASDHGEQLGEHGLFEHQNSLYRTAIHVPLLIHAPNDIERAVRIGEPVSLRDIGATVLDLAGLSVPASGIGGRSLSRFWRQAEDFEPASAAGADTVFSVLNPLYEGQSRLPRTQVPVMYSLSDSAHHYILNVDGSEELYAVKEDPGELRNLTETPDFQSVLAAFRAMMTGVLGEMPAVLQREGG